MGTIKATIIIILLIASVVLIGIAAHSYGYAKGQLDAFNGKQMYEKVIRPSDTIIKLKPLPPDLGRKPGMKK